jgi:hypothetical protein
MKKLTGGVLLLVAFGACSSIAPVAINTGDTCFRCRRPIIDTRLAAEGIDGTLVSKFRTSGCIARYLADHPADASKVFVTDFTTGKLVPAQNAFYVETLNRDNGEKDYIAFATRAAADAEAFSRRAQWLTWNAVTQRAAQQARGN